jgi:hypothetical protein
MHVRRTFPILLSFFVVGVGALFFLGSRGMLPPALADAYESVASLASSASGAFSASRTASDAPDAGSAARRLTQAAPLSSAQLGAPLVHGRFVSECGATDDMKVIAKVTVKTGRAVGASATTDPPNPAVASCVEKAIREMQWDVSPKTQHLTVTY